MPKILASCHYNEDGSNQHLKKHIRYWLVQINRNKFATGQILEKPVEVVNWAILAALMCHFTWVSSLEMKTTITWFDWLDAIESPSSIYFPQP